MDTESSKKLWAERLLRDHKDQMPIHKMLLEKKFTWISYEKVKSYYNLTLLCEKGHTTTKTIGRWIENWKCVECEEYQKSIDNASTLSLEYQKRGYILCAFLIRNTAHPVTAVCPVGHPHVSYPNNFLKGQNCSVCANNQKKFYQDVEESISAEGYKLLASEYSDNKSPLPVVCDSGHNVYDTTWDKWYDGHRCPQCAYTKGEGEVGEFLKSHGISYLYNDLKILNGKQLDFYLPDYKVAIEYNGLYWHSEDLLTERLKRKDINPEVARYRAKLYHKFKRDECHRQGIRLFTIFENEWLEKGPQVRAFILGTLKVHQKVVYARNCKLEVLENAIARDFLSKHHWQGSPSSINLALGLFHGSELLQIMSFGNHPRQNVSKEEILLNRFCSRSGVKVIGGASKLFKHALKMLPKGDIITYADLRYASGGVYEALGFKLKSVLGPDYAYFKGQKIFSKQSMKKKPGEGEMIPERKLRESQNYRVIWDCGKHVYKFKRV